MIPQEHDILRPNTMHLGFGCAGLLNGLDHGESLRLLETALDSGISYFDTARMYGFGGAEGVLGTLVPRRRDKMIIASKVGILPASRSFPVRALNRGVKLLHKAVPKLRSHIPTPTRIHPRFGVFGLSDVRKSIETSLRELRTDYLDILLLHECAESDVENDELQYFLQSLQKDGKIRKFGIATGIEETIKIVEARPVLCSVVQIASSIWNLNIERLSTNHTKMLITHSTLTERFHELARHFTVDNSLAEEWRSAINIDPRDQATLAQLLLAHALHLNPGGVVLFFSRNPAKIRMAVEAAVGNHISTKQIEGLNNIIKSKSAALRLDGTYRDHLSVS